MAAGKPTEGAGADNFGGERNNPLGVNAAAIPLAGSGRSTCR
jgi:hypothetical protein